MNTDVKLVLEAQLEALVWANQLELITHLAQLDSNLLT